MPKNRIAALAALCLAVAAPLSAGAADYRTVVVETEPMVMQEAPVPACEDPRVLAQIEDQFEYGAPRVIPAPLEVAQFSNLFERAYFPVGGDRQIERRYCQGEAAIAGVDIKDGNPLTTVYYVIEYPMGYASMGWRAEGCFLGFDKWKVYGANCESLRRF
ncbi:hypothetical protein [Aureimonas mangrovi]|uniref:hypothetical protein n=1 Tax=Aureimonas mangrovi TaxID=2758041 RepID=UPI00163DDA42|nr:hypothetical protein [Aureimonas mangrovi]